MKRFLKLGIAVVLFTGLSGCFSPVNVSSRAYMIKATPAMPIYRTHYITLVVASPDSSPAYNTTQMSYSTKPYEIAYYALNRWAETPSQMLQPLIVQTLRKTKYFHAIVTPPFVAQYDYTLMTYIIRLDQNYTLAHPVAEWLVNAQIVSTATGYVVASKQFFIREPIRQCNPYGSVLATNRATVHLLREIAEFCLQTIKS